MRPSGLLVRTRRQCASGNNFPGQPQCRRWRGSPLALQRPCASLVWHMAEDVAVEVATAHRENTRRHSRQEASETINRTPPQTALLQMLQ
jgi:hypothetical protein